MSIVIPALEALDLSGPLPEGWDGPRGHIGPVQTVTPLVDRLSGKTTCATVVLMAGVVLWGERRLRDHADTAYLRELAEAMFAWQADWRFVETEVEPRGKPPEQPIEASAPMVYRSFVRKSIRGEKPWHSFYQPIMELFHLANVTNFLLGNENAKSFEVWLTTCSDRLDEIAAAPDLEVPVFSEFESKEAYRAYCAPRRGVPLPPEVLDLGADCSALDLDAASSEFIASLDPARNRYLRSAEELAGMDVTNVPFS